MKILLYSKAFHPMVGGIETVAATMAEMFTRLGHECVVMTAAHNPEPDTFGYQVYRRAGVLKTIRLVTKADIVVSKGASLALVPYCLLLFKPFIWIHSGYQASCIDGLGWVDGEPAPLTPRESIAYHRRRSGLLYAIKCAFKLYLRRFASRHIVAMNVAVSDWVAMRQPFDKQVTIHNPFPIYRFAGATESSKPMYDFLYLGRLVSEKGVGTLIRALALLVQRFPDRPSTLLIVGEGSWQPKLERLAREMGVENHIIFGGRKTGHDLVEIVSQCRIAVVPSEWEEPMGGVALELLAAGKPLIASRNGGVSECVGDAALLFDNGDHAMLADCMWRLLEDTKLRESLVQSSSDQLKKFDPEQLASKYLSLFDQVLGNARPDREGELRLADEARR